MKMLLPVATLLTFSTSLAAAAEAVGKAPYDRACKSCHGAEGQGNPAIAKAMRITLRHLGSKEVQAKSDADLKKDTTEGIGKMKPVKSLSAQQVDQVVAFIRTLKP